MLVAPAFSPTKLGLLLPSMSTASFPLVALHINYSLDSVRVILHTVI